MMDTYVLIQLIRGRNLDLEEALRCVATIHTSYVNKIAPAPEDTSKEII